MILHDSKHYRIERISGTPKPFALDRKEYNRADHPRAATLVNLGWFDSDRQAFEAMNADVLLREGVQPK